MPLAAGPGCHGRATPRLSPWTRQTKLGWPLLRKSPKVIRQDAVDGGGRSRSRMAAMLKSGWALRGMLTGLLVTWYLLTNSAEMDARPDEVARASASVRWRSRRSDGLDARLAPVALEGLRSVGICTNLAGPAAAAAAGARHTAARFSWIIEHHRPGAPDRGPPAAAILSTPAVLVVVVATAGPGDADDQRADIRDHSRIRSRLRNRDRDHNRNRGTSPPATCAQVTTFVEVLRKSQTLAGFGVEMLVLDPGAKGLQPRGRDCPGFRHFDTGSVIAADEASSVRATRAPGVDRPPAVWDFIVFLGPGTQEGQTGVDLQATTLEKLALVAKGRHVDLESIQSPGSTADHVCLSPTTRADARLTCHARGAPILLRVPVWLSKVQLAGWVGAVSELITGATAATRASAHAMSNRAIPDHSIEARRVSDGLVSLFCAGDEALAANSLRESQLLGPDGPTLTSRSGLGTAPSTCDRVRARLPHLHVSRAAFSVAYESLSRERHQGDSLDGKWHVDDKAAMAGRDTAIARRRSKSRTPRPSSNHGLHAAATSSTLPGFLMLVPWLEHGGADQFNVNLARALTRMDVRVVIVTTLSSGHPTAQDFYSVTCDVFHLPHLVASPSDTLGVLDVLTHLVVTRNVQVVMISNSAFGYKHLSHLRIALTAMRRGHVRFVDFVHLEEMEWGEGGYAAMSVAHAQHLDHTFAASQHVASWMRERARRVRESARSEHQRAISARRPSRTQTLSDNDRISVAYIGVDTHALRPLTLAERSSGRSDMFQTLGKIRTDTPVIAYIARMVEQKFPELYFEIVRQLREERQMEFVTFAIGGGPKLAELRANVSRHPLLERTVLTLGMLNNTETIRALAMADVLLLPSRNEGISLAAYEAMALGVSPVVSAVGGQCELVADGAGACITLDLAGPADVLLAAGPFVDELERLLLSRELMARRSRVARQRVLRKFDIANTVLALSQGLCR